MAINKKINGIDYKISYDENGKEISRVPVSQGSGRASIQKNVVSGANKPVVTRKKPVAAIPTDPSKVQKVVAPPSSGRTAPMPTDPSKVEKVGEQVDFNQWGIPDAISSEDPRSIEKFQALETYRPPSGENVTREEKLAYDLGYTQKALAASAAETASIRKGVGAEQENIAKQRETDFYKQQADRYKGRTEVNPAFAGLSAQEQQFARLEVDPDTGQLVQRETPRIAETISADTGRAPITGGTMELSREEKLAQWQNSLASARRFSPGAARSEKMTAKQIKMDQAELDMNEVDKIREDLANFKIDLGLERGQSIKINDDGSVDIIEESGDIFDPVKRAEERFNREKNQQISDAKEIHQKNIDNIKASAMKDDGTLTIQGQRDLLKANAEFNQKIARFEEKSGEDLEKVIVAEKKNQKKVEEFAKVKTLSLEDKVKRSEQQQYTDLVNSELDASRDENGVPTMTLAEASRNAKKTISELGKDGAKNLQSFQSWLKTPGAQTAGSAGAFQKAVDLSGGDANAAQTLLEKTTNLAVAKDARAEWLSQQGFDPELVFGSENEAQKQSNFVQGKLKGGTAISYMDQIEINSPDKAERIYQKALDNQSYAGDPTMEALIKTRMARLGGGGGAMANTLAALQENPNLFGSMGQSKKDELIEAGYIPPIGSALTENQRTNLETTIIKGFNTGTQEARDAQRQVKIMNASLKQAEKDFAKGGDINAASQGILVTFQKILDPTSVVRESEYARSGDGQSLLDRIQGFAIKMEQGGAGVTLEGLQNFVKLGNVFLKGYEQSRVNQARRSRRRANQYNLNEDVIFDPDTLKLLDRFDKDKERTQSIIDNLTPEERQSLEDDGADFSEFENGNRPERNLNPINIKSGGVGDEFAKKDDKGNPVTDEQGHLVFESPEMGVNAGKADLKAKIEGRSRFLDANPTIQELGSVFAEDPNWANAVASILGVDINTSTQDVDFEQLFQAIARQEGGSSLIKNA